jgi:signal transduction histidine kinase/CheY-like chemotaxis protein
MTRATGLEKDQLLVYANNHLTSVYYQVGVAGFFLVLRHTMNGMPHGFAAWFVEIAALAISPYMLLRQMILYRKITAAGDRMKLAECQAYVPQIGANRLAYLLPWLTLMFWPIQTEYLYQHTTGYLFVFAVLAAYATASAAVPELFFIDVGTPAVFGLCVSFANWHVQETQGAALAVVFFGIYALLLGRTIRQSTAQLITTKYQLKKAAHVAAEANKAKSSFLALMSHEIRTPMTGIFGMIDFLKQTGLTDEQRSFINTISDCSRTLLNTLNDILDFSKVESGKLDINKINYDFHGVLENSVRILHPIAEHKGLALNLEIAPDVPHSVHGDPHRIQQVTLNLLNNAVKFTGKGSVSLKASYIAGDAANDQKPAEPDKPAIGSRPRLRVEVADTGIGISKENIGKLFSAFSQADSSISRKYGGTGLGLSIARSLIGLMGGRIDVFSEEGKGSTFWYEVPFETPVAEAADAAADAAAEAVGPLNILVAEDNPVNEQIITRLLTQKGHKVTNVRNGNAAVAAVKVHPYDLIFMDVNMPGMNGIDATVAIRASGPKLKAIPIVGLTANVLEEYVRKCYDAGMVAHVGKPFEPATIHATLARVMKASKQQPGATGGAAVDAAPPATTDKTVPDKAATAKAPPEPAKPGYGVVGQKKVLAVAPKSMRDVLLGLRDELGLEYLQQTVINDLEEVQGLLANLKAHFQDGKFEDLGHAAHDIKSVSGLIGMQKTSAMAAAIEAACLKGETAGIAEAIPPLEESARLEGAETAEIAKTMPES